jgi:hypothetical protein
MVTMLSCLLQAILSISIIWSCCVACEDHSHRQGDWMDQENSGSSNLQTATQSSNGVAMLSQHRHLEYDDATLLVPETEDCGFEEPTATELASDQFNMRLWSFQRSGNDVPINYTIPTYFHILQYNALDLLISDVNVQTYMNYLSTAFDRSQAPFRFSLLGITRTINATWSNDCRNSTYQIAYRSILKRGGKETLNIYVCNAIPLGPQGGSITGFATLPSSNPGITDGVTIVRTTPTDLQRPNTLVHEVVRLLGLSILNKS